MIGMIASGICPELFAGVTSGGFLVPSTIESRFDARSALSSISKLSKVLSLADTLVFLAISVLVGVMLKYLEIGTLRSIITVDVAYRISTGLVIDGASTICCDLRSTGAVINNSSWAIRPLESILKTVSTTLVVENFTDW